MIDRDKFFEIERIFNPRLCQNWKNILKTVSRKIKSKKRTAFYYTS